MSELVRYNEQAILGAISKEGGVQPGRDREPIEDEERILAGHPDVNMPALLTRDVLGG
jgi:hypothetical protein